MREVATYHNNQRWVANEVNGYLPMRAMATYHNTLRLVANEGGGYIS